MSDPNFFSGELFDKKAVCQTLMDSAAGHRFNL